jgi:colicin import membrane protein
MARENVMSAETQLVAIPPAETGMTVFSTEKRSPPWRTRSPAIKTALDNVGKKLVADLKEIPKWIDAERKRVRDPLDA